LAAAGIWKVDRIGYMMLHNVGEATRLEPSGPTWRPTMREYNAAELDLMAKAYERAYERNSASLENLKNANPLLVSSVVESLVSGIVEAIDQGERNEEFLVSAALSKINSLLAGPTS
jgi:hypothetical protein